MKTCKQLLEEILKEEAMSCNSDAHKLACESFDTVKRGLAAGAREDTLYKELQSIEAAMQDTLAGLGDDD